MSLERFNDQDQFQEISLLDGQSQRGGLFFYHFDLILMKRIIDLSVEEDRFFLEFLQKRLSKKIGLCCGGVTQILMDFIQSMDDLFVDLF